MRFRNILIAVLGLFASATCFTQGNSPTSANSTIPTIPVVVKRLFLANQTQAINAATLYTPTQDGLFQVSMYLSTTTVGESGSASWSPLVAWQDESGATVTTIPGTISANSGALGFSFGSANVYAFRAVANTPITFTVEQVGINDPGATYELCITVMQIM